MIEKQREKEFLFELEQLYHKYNLIIYSTMGIELLDLRKTGMFTVTEKIEIAIDRLKEKR